LSKFSNFLFLFFIFYFYFYFFFEKKSPTTVLKISIIMMDFPVEKRLSSDTGLFRYEYMVNKLDLMISPKNVG